MSYKSSWISYEMETLRYNSWNVIQYSVNRRAIGNAWEWFHANFERIISCFWCMNFIYAFDLEISQFRWVSRRTIHQMCTLMSAHMSRHADWRIALSNGLAFHAPWMAHNEICENSLNNSKSSQFYGGTLKRFWSSAFLSRLDRIVKTQNGVTGLHPQ